MLAIMLSVRRLESYIRRRVRKLVTPEAPVQEGESATTTTSDRLPPCLYLPAHHHHAYQAAPANKVQNAH